MLRHLPLLMSLLALPLSVLAAGADAPPDLISGKSSTDTSQKAVTPPPPLPNGDDEQQAMPEPEVNIIQRDDKTIEEYSVNGQLRYIKVTPRHGVPYYIVDTDGDGVLDQQFDNLENPPIAQWILFRW